MKHHFPLLLLCGFSSAVSAQSHWTHPDATTHWYQAVAVPGGITWQDANLAAAQRGGHLVTITSKEEGDFVFSLVDRAELWRSEANVTNGPWIGGVQGPTASDPGSGWSWTELESFQYSNWASNQPDDPSRGSRAHLGGQATRAATWADASATERRNGYVIEFDGPNRPRTVGLLADKRGAYAGYTLFNDLFARTTHLIDMRGREVQRWSSQFASGAVAYLLSNGNLIRCGNVQSQYFRGFGGGGGIIEEFDWDDKRVWHFDYSTDKYVLHHDIEVMPNGNILAIAWVWKTRAEAIAAGRNPSLIPGGSVWPDKVVEIERTPTGGRVVWEWNTWDHLIQDHDPTKANYGDVAKHPERVDLNYVIDDGPADWMHSNAIDYNPALDQIMLSVRSFDELWIIDHSTTTAEARGSTGGRSGKGGDLLYRWGNPRAYRAGTSADRRLYRQHDCQWIEAGLPGAGNLLVFNNGTGRPGGDYSTADEIVPPKPDSKGNYAMVGGVWGPADPKWTHSANQPMDFYSRLVSGAQRQPNGNTLICGGWTGEVFEVTPAGAEVWRYRNPVTIGKTYKQGEGDVVQAGMFRAPRYPPDFSGFRGRDLTPGEPIEEHATVLLVDGSTLSRRVAIGSSADLSLRADGHDGKLYIAATALARANSPIDYRYLGLALDVIFFASFSGDLSGIFQNYVGVLDASGRAKAKLALPVFPKLVGSWLHTQFLVVDLDVRSGVQLISNQVSVEVIGR